MRINIYLTHYEKKQLSELKFKYHLSFSTIANIIVKYTTETAKICEYEEYKYKDKASKTSIKPSTKQNPYWLEGNYNKSILFTNAVRRYLKGDYNDIDEKIKTKMLNKIINDFRNTYDPNWNGNEFQRAIPRIIKQNPEYFRKLLEEC